MSEYMFCLTKRRLTEAQVDIVRRIVDECGGDDFVYVGPGGIPGNDLSGWCTAPNRGEPFNRRLRAEVLARLEEEGVTL